MAINKIPFEEGPVTTMIERLYKTMNAMDKEWSRMIKPASFPKSNTNLK